MTSEARKRANKKYYEKVKDCPEFKEAAVRRDRQRRNALLDDPVNRERVYAIKNYLDKYGLKLKGLALQIDCDLKHLRRVTGFSSRVMPEEFKSVPELYETLVATRGEEEGCV